MNTLSLRFKCGYAAAEAGINATEILIRLYLLNFYTDMVGLSPWYAGLAGFIGLIWDAITDPIIGQISDRTQGRFKGRSPFLFNGTLLLSASLVILFSPPQDLEEFQLFLYMLIAYLLLNTALTILAVPYMALASGLTNNRNERSVLFALRFAFGNLGSLAAVALPGLLLASAHNRMGQVEAMAYIAWLIAGLILVTGLISWSTTLRFRSQVFLHSGLSIFESLRSIKSNKAFLPLLGSYTIATFGVTLNSGLARYYYLYRLRLTEAEVGILLVFFMFVFTLSLIGWVRISRTYGKLKPLRWGIILLGIGSSIFYPLFPVGNLMAPMIVAGGILGGLVGCVVLLDSILTDVIDLDQIKHGNEKSGIYFGIWRFASKLARATAFFITGALLSHLGFQPNMVQSETVSIGISWVFGPGVGICLILSGIVLITYKFDDSKQKQVSRLLQKRRKVPQNAI